MSLRIKCDVEVAMVNLNTRMLQCKIPYWWLELRLAMPPGSLGILGLHYSISGKNMMPLSGKDF